MSLAAEFPELCGDWDFDKNDQLVPERVSSKSKKKVWWLCSQGHSWLTSVQARSLGGTGCPVCSGRKVLAGVNDLTTLFPEIAEEWDYQANGVLTPDQVGGGSKRKVWWVCSKGHPFLSQIQDRTGTKKITCSVCSGRSVLAGVNDLATTDPKLLDKWDFEMNVQKPTEVSRGMRAKFWWKCELGHSYQSNIGWVVRGTECGICSTTSSQVLMGTNDLATLYPELVRELHPSLNGDFDPTAVRSTSARAGKLWWVCNQGHEYMSNLGNRTRGSGCPFCSKTGFNPEKPGVLYVLESLILGAMKVGITGASIRTNRLRSFELAGWVVVNAWLFEVGSEAADVERTILAKLRERNGGPFNYLNRSDLDGRSGHTEMFSRELIEKEELFSLVDQVLLYSNYIVNSR